MNFLSGWVSNYSAKLQEIVGASSAVVMNDNVEVGSTIPLRSLEGEIFPCAVLMIDTQYNKSYIKDKHMLAITKTLIVELSPVAHPLGSGLVHEVHELSALAKLKFRRPEKSEGIMILEYKSGKISKFVMANPLPCVELIKHRMSEMGVGQDIHKCATSLRNITNANEILEQAKVIEGQFATNPSLALVEEMMGLMRQAVEKFAEANDPYYSTVVQHLKGFLQRNDVVAVLEANGRRAEISPVRPKFAIADDDDEVSSPSASVSELNAARDPVLAQQPEPISEQSGGSIAPLQLSAPSTPDPFFDVPSPQKPGASETPKTPTRFGRFVDDPLSELKPEELKMLESLTLPSPMMSPNRLVAMSEEETFQILSQAVTYHTEEEEDGEGLLDVSTITTTKVDDSDLLEMLSKFNQDLDSLVQGKPADGVVEGHRTISTSSEGAGGYEQLLDELDKELSL